MSTEPEKKTFKGGCHCKFITYEVSLALPAEPKARRCACTICTKTSTTLLFLPSAKDFKLLSPTSWAEAGDYQPSSPEMHKYFCLKCGCQVAAEGVYRSPEKTIEYFILNVPSIDQPQEGIDLSSFKIEYMSALDEKNLGAPRDTPYPCGMI